MHDIHSGPPEFFSGPATLLLDFVTPLTAAQVRHINKAMERFCAWYWEDTCFAEITSYDLLALAGAHFDPVRQELLCPGVVRHAYHFLATPRFVYHPTFGVSVETYSMGLRDALKTLSRDMLEHCYKTDKQLMTTVPTIHWKRTATELEYFAYAYLIERLEAQQ